MYSAKAEGQFLKTALEDFDKNQVLSEHREERVENLYKEKPRLIPINHRVSLEGSRPKKIKPGKPRRDAVF